MLLVEAMEYDADLAATRTEFYTLDSGNVLGGTSAYLLFGNRRSDGTARYLGQGGANVDNAPQLAAKSQGGLSGESIDEVSFIMSGHGPAYRGDTTYASAAAPAISMQRASSSWSPT